MNFVRPSKDYSFYGQTMSLCETCLKLVHAKVVIEGDNVFYLKRCPSHGMQKTLVSTDAAYFKSCKDFIKPGDLPLHYQSTTEHGCPYDCGLCPDHEQHSCLALIEINDACNLACPVCFADSSPQRTRCWGPWWRARAAPIWCRSAAASPPSIRRSSKSCGWPNRSRSATSCST